MLEWLRSLFGGKARPALSVGTRQASLRHDDALPDPAEPALPEDPFDFSQVAEFDPELREPLDPAQDDESKAIGAQVVAHFLKGKTELPSFPALALRVLEVAREPDVSINRFVSVVSQDPAVVTKILRVANSPFYGGVTEITSARDAVTRIGLKEATDIASAASTGALFQLGKRSPIPDFDALCRALWHHSMTCAFAAGNLSMQLRKGSSDRAFLGGMLHDVGKMIALRSLSELAERGELQVGFTPARLASILEHVHLNLGFEAVATWRLPEFVLEICMNHHGAVSAKDAEQSELHAIRLVSGLNELRCNPRHPTNLVEEVTGSARALRLSAKQLRALVADLHEFADKADILAG